MSVILQNAILPLNMILTDSYREAREKRGRKRKQITLTANQEYVEERKWKDITLSVARFRSRGIVMRRKLSVECQKAASALFKVQITCRQGIRSERHSTGALRMQKTDYQALPLFERLNRNNQLKAHQLCRSNIAERVRYECWRTMLNM